MRVSKWHIHNRGADMYYNLCTQIRHWPISCIVVIFSSPLFILYLSYDADYTVLTLCITSSVENYAHFCNGLFCFVILYVQQQHVSRTLMDEVKINSGPCDMLF